jgi:hypothetical protein
MVLGWAHAKLYFLQSGQESKIVSVILMEGTCDAAIICAVQAEHLDTRELQKEPAPWNNFLFRLGIIEKDDRKFIRGDKLR